MAKNDETELVHEIEELTKDNEHLKSENQILKKELEHTPHRHSPWRGLGIGVCVLIAAILLTFGNVIFWTSNTLLNTDKFVQTTQPVLEDQAVQTAIAGYTAGELFRQVDVQSIIQEALPPRADFLAQPLTTQLQKTTTSTLKSVIASAKFQNVWNSTVRTAHDRLITTITKSNGDGVISLQDIYSNLSQNLQGTKLSFLSGKTLPNKFGSITVVSAPWIPKARVIINDVGWLKPLVVVLTAAFIAGALWISRRRRLTVMVAGVATAIAMAITLIGVHILKNYFVLQASSTYQTAADHASSIILHPFVVQSISIGMLGLVALLTAWISGPYLYAGFFRHQTKRWLTDPLHRLIFVKEGEATKWVGRYRYSLEWACFAVVFAAGLIREVSPKMIVIYLLISLVLVLIVETIAQPASKKQERRKS